MILKTNKRSLVLVCLSIMTAFLCEAANPHIETIDSRAGIDKAAGIGSDVVSGHNMTINSEGASDCDNCGSAVGRSAFAYRGFSGGMTFHTGYISAGTVVLQGAGGETFPSEMRGMPIGIGGAVKIHFGKYLRIGAEGYSTTLTYGSYGSRFTTGWGGILVDGCCRIGRWVPFAGVTLGGGVARNVTLTAPVRDDFRTEEDVSYRRYGFAALTPFVGLEYAATSSMHLILKVDLITNVSAARPDFPTGLRLYIGFSFYRVKSD